MFVAEIAFHVTGRKSKGWQPNLIIRRFAWWENCLPEHLKAIWTTTPLQLAEDVVIRKLSPLQFRPSQQKNERVAVSQENRCSWLAAADVLQIPYCSHSSYIMTGQGLIIFTLRNFYVFWFAVVVGTFGLVSNTACYTVIIIQNKQTNVLIRSSWH